MRIRWREGTVERAWVELAIRVRKLINEIIDAAMYRP
jgi:hypothetical protein